MNGQGSPPRRRLSLLLQAAALFLASLPMARAAAAGAGAHPVADVPAQETTAAPPARSSSVRFQMSTTAAVALPYPAHRARAGAFQRPAQIAQGSSPHLTRSAGVAAMMDQEVPLLRPVPPQRMARVPSLAPRRPRVLPSSLQPRAP